jgi:4-hydroxy-3-methylbut-2-enyl diphosphate reductase
MEVRLAQSAGFCFGVDRAVRLAEEIAGPGAKMLGTVIHNRQVVDQLSRRGMAVIRSPQEALPGDRVLLRAHGEGQAVYEALKSRGAEIVDATCPKVQRVQRIVRQAEEEGRQPLMIGDPAHPEVIGIGGWCRKLLVFPGPEELESWTKSDVFDQNTPLTVVAQTTLIRRRWETSLKTLKNYVQT